jgi:hypothetical protein
MWPTRYYVTLRAPRLIGSSVIPAVSDRRQGYDLSPGCFHQGSLLGGGEDGIRVAAAGC